MSTIEKNIHINFTARNLVTPEVDKVSGAITGLNVNLQRVPYYFMSAGHALDTLNRQFFTYQETIVRTDALGKMHTETITRQNEALKALSGAFLLVGESLRVIQLIQTFIKVLDGLTIAHKMTAVAAEEQGVAEAVTIGITSWGTAVPIILAAAAGAAIGAAAIYASSRQFGGYMPEGGLVMTHPGEWVIPKGGGGSVYIDVHGNTLSNDYDADRLGDRLIFAMKRAGVTGP
jgi:hypothetical protein